MRDREAQNVLVVGGAGRTGRLLVGALVERGYSVRATARDVERARTHLPSDVEIIAGDLESLESIAEAVAGVEVVVFAASAGAYADGRPGSVDFNGVVHITDAALKAGVGYMVLMSSASVTHPEHPHNCTFNSVLKWKARGERHLRGSGLPYTIVRALGLRDREGGVQGVRMVQGDRLAYGEDIARQDAATFLANLVSLRASSSTTAEDAAKVGFERRFQAGSLLGATLEIYNDATISPGTQSSKNDALTPDPRPHAFERHSHV